MESISVYEKNLSAIKSRHPELYSQICKNDFIDDEDINIEIYRNRTGKPLVVVENRLTGKIVRLHEEEDPENEARKITDSININPGDVRFVIGMGLGYIPLEIARRSLAQLKLFIVEPCLKLFIEAVRNLDLTTLFEAEGVAFFVGEIDDIKPAITAMEADIPILMKGAEVTFFEPERELFPEYFTAATKKIHDQAGHLMCGVHTAEKIGPVFFENGIWNFTTVINSANLGVLGGIFKGKTALVVGAGPSLHENIQLIKKYRNRFAIITVDSSIPVLVRNGIIPDLSATVDYHHISFEKYRDVIEFTSEIPMVFASQCAAMTIKPYRCPIKFFIAQPLGIYSDLSGCWEYWANWSNMQAVSHLALATANITNPDTVILAGFDLSFVELKSYTEGTSLMYNIDIESMVWVRDQDGESVPTTIQMVGQKALMEYHVSSGSAHFFNIGKGVKIEGAEKTDFEKLADSLPEMDINIKEIIRSAWEKAPRPSAQAVIDYLDKSEKDLGRFLRLCDKGIDAARSAKKALEKSNDASFHRCGHLVKKAIEYYEDILSGSSAVETALSFFEGRDMSLKMDEFRLGIDSEKKSKRLRISAEMDFIARAADVRKKAAQRLTRDFSRLHGRLSREEKLLSEISVRNHGKQKADLFVKLGNIYLDYMDFVQAEDAFRNALKENENSGEALAGLGKTLGKLKRHREALECLEKALSFSPESGLFRKYLENEKKYPEKMLIEAASYINGSPFSAGAQGRESWALRIANEILAFYPDNRNAAEIAEKAQKIISETREKQEKLLPYLIAGPENAIEMLDADTRADNDFAIRVLELIKKQHPSNAAVIEYLGLLYLNRNDVKTAKKFFAQARSLAPESYSPRIHLAQVLVSEGNLEEALMYLMQARDLAPPETGMTFTESIGDLLFELKRYDEALENYRSAIQYYPQNIEIFKKIGDSYAALGKPEAAELAWKASGIS